MKILEKFLDGLSEMFEEILRKFSKKKLFYPP